MKRIYLVLSIAGLVLPYCFFVGFLKAHGLDARAFLQQLFGTQISTFFATDLLLSGVVFVIYFRRESRRYSMKHGWLYLIALCAVGLSFALPLFLYFREDHLATLARQSDSQ